MVSLPDGLVADVNGNKHYSWPISSLLTGVRVTTTGAYVPCQYPRSRAPKQQLCSYSLDINIYFDDVCAAQM